MCEAVSHSYVALIVKLIFCTDFRANERLLAVNCDAIVCAFVKSSTIAAELQVICLATGI